MDKKGIFSRVCYLMNNELDDKQLGLISLVLGKVNIAIKEEVAQKAKKYEALKNGDQLHTWKAQQIRKDIKELAELKQKVKGASSMVVFKKTGTDINL